MNREEIEEEKDECKQYKFTREDIDAVNGVNWYEMFKEISAKTLLLSIPPEVLKYLKSDGMVMPENTHTTAHQTRNEGVGRGSESKSGEQDDDNDSWASLSDTDEVPCIPSEFLQKISRDQRAERRQGLGSKAIEEDFGPEEGDFELEGGRHESSDSEEEDKSKSKNLGEVEKFHEFDSLLDSSIKNLGGAVLPKINRKAPRDATWIGFNRSLKCYNPGDIYLLLKTSDVVSHLLEDPYRDCCDVPDENGASSASVRSPSRGIASTSFTNGTTPYVLVLKQWHDSWGPEMEFRCFICANQLIAICQRDLDTCYSSIAKRKDKLILNMQNFFLRNIHDRFPLDFYTMDIVYHPNGEIYLVDFDVFGLCTDPLLFTYKELESIYKDVWKHSSTGSNEDNRLKTPTRQVANRRNPTQPCLRFLTESRSFRGRKTTGQSALTNDVMTYIRESVARM